MKKNIARIICLVLLCGGLLAEGCTKYETPGFVDEAQSSVDTASVKKEITRHVLWVNIDGARGSVVKEQVESGALPHLQSMLEHSKYTWSGLSDNRLWQTEENRTGITDEDPVSWVSMLTGVSSTSHFVRDDSYSPDFNITEASQTVVYFPNLLQLVSEADASMLTACVTPYPTLNTYLLQAGTNKTTADDEETRREVCALLSGENNYSLILTAFKGVAEAGRNGGFAASNGSYVSALKTVDGYIGEYMDSINARPQAADEDWLVVVSSNIGGKPDGTMGGTSDEERDIFGIFYYNHYTSFEMKGETMEAIFFDADGEKQNSGVVYDSLAVYALRPERKLSIEFNLRLTLSKTGEYGNGGTWSKLLGKGAWGFFRQHQNTSFYVNASGGEGAYQKNYEGMNNDGLWHSWYAGMGEITANQRRYLIAYDGEQLTDEMDENMGEPADSADFKIGWRSLATGYFVHSIRIYNDVLDDATIASHANATEIGPSDPSYSKLIAEWVFKSSEVVEDSIIPNRVKVKNPAPDKYPEIGEEMSLDMHFNKKPLFVKLANCLPDKRESGNLMMENTLIAPQILYWLGGASLLDPRMEGYNFLSNYQTEEEWREYVEE